MSIDIPAKDIVILSVELDIILLKVAEQLICTQDFGNLHQLVVIIVSVEEWLLAEDLYRTFSVWKEIKLCDIFAPLKQTCTPGSTYPSCNRIPGSQQEVPDP